MTTTATLPASTETSGSPAVISKWDIIYWLKKIWNNISIEPVMLCWLMPQCFLYIAMENLSLEKVFFYLFF